MSGIKGPDAPTNATKSASAPFPTSNTSSSLAKPEPKPAQATATDSSLNPRSCVTCRRRKVRCNKREPCSNCVKAGIECVFPGPGRAPRKPRRPPDVELLSRLRRLEGVVESLGGTDAIEKLVSANRMGGAQLIQQPPQPQAPSANLNNAEKPSVPGNMEVKKDGLKPEEVGRLVIDDNRSLYVSNRLWTSIGDQVEELQDILDSPSEDEEDSTSPGESVNSANRSNDAFIFGYSSLAHSLRNYHPTPSQIFILWKTYEQNVAPLLTVVHKPTIRDIIINAATSFDLLDKNSEALAFSLYLTAVISMSPEQCLAEIGDDRDSVINRFRFATEQAMARANLLTSRNINLLQAAVMFVTSILRQDQSRFVWTLSAVILRLATGLGLHRDGTNFGLSPFETEMRRRLWWHICIMDIRAAEDHGTDPMINDMMYDTKMPLHINDDDISPDSKTFPPERHEFTDMTATLIRAHISTVYRRLNYVQPGQNSDPIQFEERKKIIEEWHNMLNEKYIKYCDMQVPIQWSCATVARLLVAKLWLIVHHPLFKDNMSTLSPEDRNRILLTSIEVIEFTHLLVTSESTTRWSWLFGAYIQWHPIAFVLAELCVRPRCPGVDRAWLAVDSVFDTWRQRSAAKKASLWRPLTKLYKKAKAFRTKQEADIRRCSSTQASITSPMELPAKTPKQNSVASNSPLFADGGQSQFSSPGQSSSPAVSAVFNHPSSTKQAEPAIAPAGELNLDLNKNMNEILVDFLPAYSMVSNTTTSDATGIYTSNSTTRTTGASGITAKPSSTPTIGAMPFEQTTWPMETPNTFDMPMNWDQFDDVMRDFQQDFEQITGQNVDNYQMDFL
ncbi:hypothetical protein UA08_05418 [Talaromyces atroroseus]|uniref:Zn(2)-C6 fungal-type domain-containing protein n=1 Tax=Talaromyces atroroseus TaxID=1441469 RepID=A0A225AMG3_TALAT|nr:hypothetical protein UA08_05418 [Talaromyces atroroseus]OKL59524.1 hypothetical protein UA08_05418 [Talaromyces atroroseus]